MKIIQELPGLEGDGSVHMIDGPGLCDLLSLSPAMLSELKKRGIAVHRGQNAYVLRATTRAYVEHLRGVAAGRGGEEHVTSLTAERARLAKEQADGQAMKNALRRGELVEAVEVERAWSDILRQVRARVLAVPSRLRQSLSLTPLDAERIDRELRDALSELGHADD